MDDKECDQANHHPHSSSMIRKADLHLKSQNLHVLARVFIYCEAQENWQMCFFLLSVVRAMKKGSQLIDRDAEQKKVCGSRKM